VLYFSTNFQGFELKESAVRGYARVEELTPGSIPEDFQRQEVHRCWRLEAPRDDGPGQRGPGPGPLR
jgi:23S rRNA (cytosine1962-C5)-methyltransferase